MDIRKEKSPKKGEKNKNKVEKKHHVGGGQLKELAKFRRRRTSYRLAPRYIPHPKRNHGTFKKKLIINKLASLKEKKILGVLENKSTSRDLSECVK